MYSMDQNKMPRRPVVLSQAAASAEFELWVRENRYEKVLDGDGLPWHVELTAMPIPDPENLPRGMWELRMEARVEVNATSLLATGTMDPIADERLLLLIGTESIPLQMKPEVRYARSLEESKRALFEMIPKVKDTLVKGSLRDIKRALIGQWIDRRCLFGGFGSKQS